MKLRHFLYINSKMIDDYVATIDGFINELCKQTINTSIAQSAKGTTGVGNDRPIREVFNNKNEEIKNEGRVSEAVRFDKIYTYLSENDEIEYYENFSEEIYSKLKRDDFIEVLVKPRFSKMKNVADTAKKFNDLVSCVEKFMDSKLMDDKTQRAISGLNALGNMNDKKQISCVFNFEDSKIPLVAYLDESYFQCEQERFVGQSYMLCKIQKKISEGQTIKLDEIFDDIKKLPLNREQRRKMPRTMANPKEIKDVIKGPALVVIPVAIYQ